MRTSLPSASHALTRSAASGLTRRSLSTIAICSEIVIETPLYLEWKRVVSKQPAGSFAQLVPPGAVAPVKQAEQEVAGVYNGPPLFIWKTHS
jgi:hypothetical protein